MNYNELRGCGTALVTPFREGQVDYEAFAALVDSQIKVSRGIRQETVVVMYSTAGQYIIRDVTSNISSLQEWMNL